METATNENWNYTVVVLGALAVLAITWHVFWGTIQPALVSLSPLFAEQSGGGRIGRYPDSFAQLALFATILIGLFVYYNLLVLIFDGIGEFIGTLEAIYFLCIVVPLIVINNYLRNNLDSYDRELFQKYRED